MTDLTAMFFPQARVSSLRCRCCGSTDVVCVDPGVDPVISEATDVVVLPGRAASGRCIECWPAVGVVA